MSQINFLIGRGELLTHDIKGPKRKPGKAEVKPAEAKAGLIKRATKAAAKTAAKTVKARKTAAG